MRSKYGLPTVTCWPFNACDQEREDGPEQHDESEPGEQQVVDQKGSLP